MEVSPGAENWKHYPNKEFVVGIARRPYNWGMYVVQLEWQESGLVPTIKSVS